AFLVAEKALAETKAGKPYLRLKLMDRTGDIEAKVWDNAERIAETFELHDVVRVRGRGEIFNEKVQLNVQSVERAAEGEYRLGDFLPRTTHDPKKMMEEFRALVDGMRNEHLRALLLAFLEDPELSRKFMTAPAALYIHHAWLGGLLEHVLSLSRLVTTIAPLYPQVDWELVLTGAFLHDLGKVQELSYHGPFAYTDEGQLIGHLTMGVLMVHDKIREIPAFPKDLELQVKHLIVGHHGRVEHGSPKLPQTIEAVALSMLDDFDSKMAGIRAATEAAQGDWTGFHRAYGRAFYARKHKAPVP
ncbi:MAG: HD domain-containing protein, partial [Candidatus Methylomirabilis sp.]|nr:HD domain-containing protein [Deltaproteobacteria bacterium]